VQREKEKDDLREKKGVTKGGKRGDLQGRAGFTVVLFPKLRNLERRKKGRMLKGPSERSQEQNFLRRQKKQKKCVRKKKGGVRSGRGEKAPHAGRRKPKVMEKIPTRSVAEEEKTSRKKKRHRENISVWSPLRAKGRSKRGPLKGVVTELRSNRGGVVSRKGSLGRGGGFPSNKKREKRKNACGEAQLGDSF